MKCSVKVDENMQKELNNELKNKSKIKKALLLVLF